MKANITIPSEELKTNTLGKKTLRSAKQIYQSQGILKINNLLSPAFVETLNQDVLSKADINDDKTVISNALKVGDKRYMVNVNIEGVFNDERIYANPLLMPIIKSLIGDDFVLNSFGAVVSLPGSDNQHFHYDHPCLFPEEETLSSMLPPYAVTIGIPLTEITLENGPTAFWPGSHLVNESEGLSSDSIMAYVGEPGFAYLWDYRTFHGGLKNNSSDIRSLLYFVYARPWFKDAVNFHTVMPLTLKKEDYNAMSNAHKTLFSGAIIKD